MKIVIKVASGGVAIMTPIFPEPPLITESVTIDGVDTVVERVMDVDEHAVWQSQFVDSVLDQWKLAHPGAYVSHRAMPDEAIPTDRTLREAWTDETPDLVIDIDLAKAKAIKIASFNEPFEAAAAQIKAGYPASEVDSWPIQEKEALAWSVDNTVSTPYIDALAVARNIPRELYLQKTVAKVNAFRVASAAIIGKRQRLEDAVKNAASLDELNAISW